MAQPDTKQRPQFSQPFQQIMFMVIALGLAVSGAVLALPSVLPVFLANLYLNGFIALVFLFGILACFWQVFQLMVSVRWIEQFASGLSADSNHPPRLLAPLASLLRSRGARMQLSSSSTQSILESVATRIDEAREIPRYIASLLIFLGLLGTFYGLATTVPAVVDTIRSLAPQEGEEGIAVFTRLMTGLEAQLGGMGVAFSSSLLGLAGSLVVGLLELFADVACEKGAIVLRALEQVAGGQKAILRQGICDQLIGHIGHLGVAALKRVKVGTLTEERARIIDLHVKDAGHLLVDLVGENMKRLGVQVGGHARHSHFELNRILGQSRCCDEHGAHQGLGDK